MGEDSELIDSCLSKNPEVSNRAFAELVRTYQRRVYAFCYRYLDDAQGAKDVSQKTFLEVYRSLHRFRRQSRLYTWIFQIAINGCRNYVRSQRRHIQSRESPDVLEQTPDTSPNAKDPLRESALRKAISLLPNKQRSVLLLRVYHEYSFREIAEILGSNENACKVDFHYALKTLKKGQTETET